MSNILQKHFYWLLWAYPLRTSSSSNWDWKYLQDDSLWWSFLWRCFLCMPDCGELKFVPFRCKSRFCSSCGNMYNQNVLFTCLVNWSTVFIDIVSLLFLKNCVFISLMTDLFLIVSFILSEMLFFVCSQTNKAELFTLDLFWFFILSGVTWNGILTFMLLSLKVVLVIILSGVLAHTLISVSFAIPSESSSRPVN